MSSLPLIDVVICTYNNAQMLSRTLEALARQETAPDVSWRVLVVNNNSTDETLNVVERHTRSGRIPDLRVMCEGRQGLHFARLCGVSHTAAPWIAFVDDDCLLEPGWIAAAARFAREHPACGAFGGQVALQWDTPPPEFVRSFGYSFAEQQHGAEPCEIEMVVGAGLVVRRSALHACGYTQRQFLPDRTGTSLASGGDVEMSLRIRGAGYQLWYVPACVLNHIIPPHRITMEYLQAINYELGKCQLLSDALTWSDSQLSYLMRQAKNTVHSSAGLLRQSLRARLGRRHDEGTRIRWSFQRGKWAGIWHMLRMPITTRQSLVGCAHHSFPSSRTRE